MFHHSESLTPAMRLRSIRPADSHNNRDLLICSSLLYLGTLSLYVSYSLFHGNVILVLIYLFLCRYSVKTNSLYREKPPLCRSLRTLQELPFLPIKMHRKNEAVKTSFPRLLLLLRKPVMCVPAFSLLNDPSIFNHLLQ